MNSLSPPVESILNRVKGTKKSGEAFTFRCPAHDDKRNSGWVKPDSSGNAILKCFAGCSRKAICEALAIRESDLYVNGKPSPHRSNSDDRIIKAYAYHDASGTLIYEHVRMKPTPKDKKPFYYRRPAIDGAHCWTLHGGWFEKKGRKWQRVEKASNNPDVKPKEGARWFNEAQRVLYRLRKLKEATPGTLGIYNEGEKDAESAEALGFVATTAGGASDWRKEFAEELAGFDLVIIPDNDAAGRNCAAKVAQDCYGKAVRVRIVQLPGLAEQGDLSDWVAVGGDRETLLALIAATPDFVPGDASDTAEDVIFEGEDVPISSDERQERHLLGLPSSAKKLLEAYGVILRMLGFEGNHTRLLVALTIIGGKNLNTFEANHGLIASKYHQSGKKVSKKTVQRDIAKFIAEQEALGVTLLEYTPGDVDFNSAESEDSKFRNLLLKYALYAINRAIDLYGEPHKFRYDWKTLQEASRQVVSEISRTEPRERTAKTKKQRARTVEELETRRGTIEDEIIAQMIADGWTVEEAEAEFGGQERILHQRIREAYRGLDKIRVDKMSTQ